MEAGKWGRLPTRYYIDGIGAAVDRDPLVGWGLEQERHYVYENLLKYHRKCRHQVSIANHGFHSRYAFRFAVVLKKLTF